MVDWRLIVTRVREVRFLAKVLEMRQTSADTDTDS
jgi:hypothetical protein